MALKKNQEDYPIISPGLTYTNPQVECLEEQERQIAFFSGEESSLPLRLRLRAKILRLHNLSLFGLSSLLEVWGRLLQEKTKRNSEQFTQPSWLRSTDMSLRVPFADYAWPTKGHDMKPFDSQVKTVVFLLQHKRCYNFSDLGTGKTLGHLWCADFLMVNDKVKQVLVVCPLSTMGSVWRSEIFFNLPHRRSRIAHGTQEDRLAAINSNADFLIINHDGVSIPAVEAAIIKKIKAGEIGIVIIDELTAYKKHTTKRSKSMQRITSACGTKVGVQGITGSPTPNKAAEAFGLGKVVNPDAGGMTKYFKQFQMKVEYQAGPYLWLPLPNSEQVVNAALQPAIRFKRSECIDIPDCQYIERIVEFTPSQRKVYDKMKDDLLVEYEAGEITAVNAAVKMTKLLQIAAGSVKDDLGSIMKLDSSTRDEQLWEIFEETGQTKLVVAAAFTATIDHLVEFFKSRGVRCEAIQGSVKHDVRTQRINDFQNGPLQVLIIQPQSASHGITLTASHVIVWYSLIASGEYHVQFNGRITRAGQKVKQLIYYLIGCKAEKRILTILQGKGDLSHKVLNLFEDI